MGIWDIVEEFITRWLIESKEFKDEWIKASPEERSSFRENTKNEIEDRILDITNTPSVRINNKIIKRK